MRCDECRAMVLAAEEDEHVRRHLAGCIECRAELPGLEADRALLMDQSIWEESSPEFVDEIVSLIVGRSPIEAVRRAGSYWAQVAAVAAVFAVALGAFALFRSPQPDWEVTLPGTSLAAAAVGTVQGWNTDSGTRMILEVDGLEPAPDGYFYEFWLSDGPLHVSAGTFLRAESVELWSGVSRADFPRLWVTLEPVDDDESPTRQTVLDTDGV